MMQDTIKAIAADMGAKPETVKKWRQRGVPYRWRLLILQEAEKRQIKMQPHDLESFPEGRERAA